MKVLNLRCTQGHLFEGWFASDDDFVAQTGRGLVDCPMCGDQGVMRMPSAPRLNLSGARNEPRAASRDSEAPAGRAGRNGPGSTPTATPVVKPTDGDLQMLWLQAVRRVLENTEDVGERFAEEARRIHYGETEHRGIRGQATPEEREALQEEGIEVMPLPLPPVLKGPAH